MILLDTTTRKLQASWLNAKTTNDCPFVTSYVDIGVSSVTSGASSNGLTNGVTAVDIVGVPGGSITRKVSHFTIYNADTAANTLSIVYNDNATLRSLWVGVIAVGSGLEYTDGKGFQVTDANGNILTGSNRVGSRIRAPQVINSGTTYTTPALCTAIDVELWGCGGGGGGAQFSTNGAVGAGGGSGGYAKKYFTVAPSTTYTVAFGAGGSQGANTGGTGGNGGSVTFTVGGVTVTAQGGIGGVGMAASATASTKLGGQGGSVSTNGDINGLGAPGHAGILVVGGASPVGTSGAGGSTSLGGGGLALSANGAGTAGTTNTGGGGAGGCAISTSQVGGLGGTGRIVVTEFY